MHASQLVQLLLVLLLHVVLEAGFSLLGLLLEILQLPLVALSEVLAVNIPARAKKCI